MSSKRGAKPKDAINKVTKVVFYTKLSNVISIGGMENARSISINAIEKEVQKSKTYLR
jgi:hypothetical protein